MKAAVAVFVVAAVFLGVAVAGVVRVGSSTSAPRSIELSSHFVPAAAHVPGRVEVRQRVESALVGGYSNAERRP